MSRRVLDLGTLSWQIGKVSRQPFGSSPADDRGHVQEWLPAQIPGDIRADLIAAGRIPPVENPDGIAAGAWVDKYDWWYRTRLDPDLLEDGAVAVLEADGIDYYSAIWLNGSLLGTHTGMFGRQTMRLPRLRSTTPNELAVRVWGSGALPRNSRRRRLLGAVLDRVHPGLVHFSDRMATTKAQFSFGWDFAPRVLSAGIWDGMRLVLARGAYIEDMWVYGEPLSETDDPTPVRWHVKVRIVSWAGEPVRAALMIAPDNFAGGGYDVVYRTIELCPEGPYPCSDEYEFELDMAVARRWWPWDQGHPSLYRVRVSLEDNRGVLDEISQRAGARTVRRDPLPGGQPWRFVVNGRPVFLRGANWVPVDVLPGRATAEDYDRLLVQARAGGMNFLRVWGGGVRERQDFWDKCDDLGLMAWQEFPLACDFLDRYPSTAGYLRTLTAEARDIVRALRSHPSLIAWCGGNELDIERESHVLGPLAQVVADHDPTRPWIPASPAEGDVHRWDIWHGLVPWQNLAQTNVPFMSEFGLQAPPDLESLAEMFPEGVPASWNDHRWIERKAQARILRYYAGKPSGTAAEAILAMQRVQAAALQLGLETCRLRRETCGGVAFWQFNEPWPAVSWAIVDRAGRPKPAYSMLAGSFQPLLVAARFPRRAYTAGDTLQAELWLVNDGTETWTGCRLEVELNGPTVHVQDGVVIQPDSMARLGAVTCRLDAPPERLALRLLAPGRLELLASNCYDLAVPLPGPQPASMAVIRWLAGRVLEAG